MMAKEIAERQRQALGVTTPRHRVVVAARGGSG